MITYKDAGVNIEEGYKAVKLMKEYTACLLYTSRATSSKWLKGFVI